jgi:3'(2'), 5'-bisphosphate nucleotidase
MASPNVGLVSLARLTNCCVQLAKEAGIVIRGVQRTGQLHLVNKDSGGGFDPQTEADLAAQRLIVSHLRVWFPLIHVIGEEGELAAAPGDAQVPVAPVGLAAGLEAVTLEMHPDEVVVWVDPLDGTREFTEGNLECVTTLIGITHRGTPVGGVVGQPWFTTDAGRTLYSADGMAGVGGPLQRPADEPQQKPRFKIVTTKSHMTEAMMTEVRQCNPTEIWQLGGAGNKVIALLEGKADAYLYHAPGMKRWDAAAPEALLRAMGGHLTDCQGMQYAYDKDVDPVCTGGILASLSRDKIDLMVKAIKGGQ